MRSETNILFMMISGLACLASWIFFHVALSAFVDGEAIFLVFTVELFAISFGVFLFLAIYGDTQT